MNLKVSLIVLSLIIITKVNGTKIEIIEKFLTSQTNNRKVTAFLCWSKAEEIKLANLLHNNSNYITIINKNAKYIKHLKETNIFILDEQCDLKKILTQAFHLNLLRIKSSWLIFSSVDKLKQLEIKFTIDSKIYISNECDVENSLFTLYTIGQNGSNTIVQNLTTSDNKYKEILIYSDRRDLKQTVLKVTFVVFNKDSLNHVTDYRYLDIDNLFKINYLVLNHAFYALNARSEMIIRDTWGYKDENTGRYSQGLIRDVQEGFSTVGGTVSILTQDRMEVVDYIAPVSPANFRFILRDPPLSYTKNIFIHPFNTYVWYCSIAMILSTFVVLYLINAYEVARYKRQDEERHSITDIIMVEISAITQQGSNFSLSTLAGRIILVNTFLIFMFLYTSYSAYIVALLQSRSDGVKTVDDLLHTSIKIGVEDAVYSDPYLKMETEPVKKMLYSKKIAPPGHKPNFMPISEGIRRVRDEFFAFHGERSLLYKHINKIYKEHEKCGLREIVFVNIINPYVTLKKDSPYKELFKAGYSKLRETGVQSREMEIIVSKKPKCISSRSFGSVGILDCYFVFVLFSSGIFLCSIVYILEYTYHKYETFHRQVLTYTE